MAKNKTIKALKTQLEKDRYRRMTVNQFGFPSTRVNSKSQTNGLVSKSFNGALTVGDKYICEVSFPLGNPTSFQLDVKNDFLDDLLDQFKDGMKKIYLYEDQTQTRKDYVNQYGFIKSNGVYQIWGYKLRDLSLIGFIVDPVKKTIIPMYDL